VQVPNDYSLEDNCLTEKDSSPMYASMCEPKMYSKATYTSLNVDQLK
jgi:hypothetical protein